MLQSGLPIANISVICKFCAYFNASLFVSMPIIILSANRQRANTGKEANNPKMILKIILRITGLNSMTSENAAWGRILAKILKKISTAKRPTDRNKKIDLKFSSAAQKVFIDQLNKDAVKRKLKRKLPKGPEE